MLKNPLETPFKTVFPHGPLLEEVEKQHSELEKKYETLLKVNRDLNRTLVSFQANKQEAGYRWYKFKEGYSSSLVSYYLNSLKITSGRVLDPFAGSGTSLFTATDHGLETYGIELLPIGQEIMWVRRAIAQTKKEKVLDLVNKWVLEKPWKKERGIQPLPHLRITKGAFSQDTEISISKYLQAIEKVTDKTLRRILRFALLCILEEISFTRKDGQYLRWDYRSGRNSLSTFNKGRIKTFEEGIVGKLAEISTDLLGVSESIFPSETKEKDGKVNLIKGSCLEQVTKLKSGHFNLIITSPPYCNRYDYTRTYALELMLLGADEKRVKELRQTMLTCTVENKEKENLADKFSKGIFDRANLAFESQKYLAEAIKYLNALKDTDSLNNPGIVRMVKNYFYELSLLIFEAARVTKKGGYFVMVNDNVRYAGIHIPVDLILSDFATDAGFVVKEIQVLPRGKGNSSQQMGKHGRTETRKCVYIWQKL